MLYKEVLTDGTNRLLEAGITEASTDAWLLFMECFSINRTHYFLKQGEPAPEDLVLCYERLLERRLAHEPVQYILGSQDFYGMTFLVNEHVLIPRLDTEVLVEHVINTRKNKGQDQSLLDLCTGSGCIAISLMANGPFTKALATDLSGEALKVARLNAQRHKICQISFSQGDLWEAVPDKERFDVIVSNPPYIALSERKDLAPEVAEHEPNMALFAEEEGLQFYRRIIMHAAEHLNPDGGLFFEIGCTQGAAVCAMLQEYIRPQGHFEAIKIVQDLSGRDRVVSAQWKID